MIDWTESVIRMETIGLINANGSQGITKRARYAENSHRESIKKTAHLYCLTVPKPPSRFLVIELILYGSHAKDSDNLAYSMKPIRDGIAKWLEVDDGDAGLRWTYSQCVGKARPPKAPAVLCRIRPRPKPAKTKVEALARQLCLRPTALADWLHEAAAMALSGVIEDTIERREAPAPVDRE